MHGVEGEEHGVNANDNDDDDKEQK